jgi:Leu/Phe-tRNA-protein transferase
MITETTLALGALEIPRSAYLDQLNRAVNLKVQFR